MKRFSNLVGRGGVGMFAFGVWSLLFWEMADETTNVALMYSSRPTAAPLRLRPSMTAASSADLNERLPHAYF